MKRQSATTEDWKVKRWEHGVLHDQPNVITNRLHLIESVSSQIAIIPETHFWWEDGVLLQRQRRIPSAVTLSSVMRRNDQTPTPETLYTFAKEMNHIHQLGLTHWDLKPANICWDGAKLYLIDWEPSLLQYRSGRLTMIVTPAYVAPSERGGAIPTALSDRFGWIKTLLFLGLRNEMFHPAFVTPWDGNQN